MPISNQPSPAATHRKPFTAAAAIALLGLSSLMLILIAGCSYSSTASLAASANQPSSASISGKVHGGQSPIYNATVSVYAAGYTGYGSSTNALATTQTDVNGGFNFPPGTYTCPSQTAQMYITSVGGNTQGTGTTATNNTAAAMMVAVGPCSSAPGVSLNINELTSAATIFSLAPYINPGSTPGTASIGTAATTQAATGLANAVASMQNLVNLSTGQPVAPPTYTGTNASVSNVIVTATAETAKLVTLANILAACINTTASTSNACADLFAAAVPPANAAVTSYGSTRPSTFTFPTAQDTIQAAYYMAVNPAALSSATFTTCNDGGTTRMACLYMLPGGSPPFQTGLSAQPSDWTIGVTYTASGSCSGGTSNGAFIAAPFHAAVDAAGNLWYVNGVSTSSNIAEMSPTGQPLFCGGYQSYGRGITIDPTGNVWGAFENIGSSNILEYNATTSTLVSWPSTSSIAPYSIVADKSGNVFYSTGSTGSIYKFSAPGTATTPATAVQIGATYSGASLDYLAADQGGRIWVPNSGANILAEYYPPSGDSATISKIGIASNVLTVTVASNPFNVGDQVTFTNVGTNTFLNGISVTLTAVTATTFTASYTHANVTAASDSGTATATANGGYDTALITGSGHGYGVAVDANGYIYTVSTCCSGAALVKYTPNSYFDNATYSTSAQYIGGINGTRGITLDGAANVWVGPEFPQTTTGVYGIAEIATSGSGTSATFTAVSPTGTLSGSCSSTADTCATNGGFQKASIIEATDIEIDPSGNVWIMNNETATSADSGTSITEIVGAAVPTATPLSVAAKNGALATKP